MFARKLKALGYHHPEGFSLKNEEEVRNLIVWLEDLKIRCYKIEDRAALRNIKDSDWIGALRKYLKDLQCPVDDMSQKTAVINWLLSHAVQLEYAENAKKCEKALEDRQKQQSESFQSLLLTIQGDDPQLKMGVETLRSILNLPKHHDTVIVLQAIAKLIDERLSNKTMNNDNKKREKDEYLPLENMSLGFDTGDSAINEASKIIRLLQIHKLRELQTAINQGIVAIQKFSANPKTDQSLGQVGR